MASDTIDDASARKLAASLKAGERAALARAVTCLETGGGAARALLGELAGAIGRARVVGFTGPPGAGKSTLVAALVRAWRGHGERVAVIAVDPSSPVSGGAILGDRLRMASALDDDDVFMRSLASQGHQGGLSPAAVRIIDAFDAAGFGRILVETVGTGQTEVDVAAVADVRVVISAPGLGDGVQAMKAGILEIADILVVNKADRPEAQRTRHDLEAALALAGRTGEVPVLATVATTGDGVDTLVARIDQLALPPAGQRRGSRARYLIERAAHDLIRRRMVAAAGQRMADLTDRVLAGALTPEDAAEALLATRRPG